MASLIYLYFFLFLRQICNFFLFWVSRLQLKTRCCWNGLQDAEVTLMKMESYNWVSRQQNTQNTYYSCIIHFILTLSFNIGILHNKHNEHGFTSSFIMVSMRYKDKTLFRIVGQFESQGQKSCFLNVLVFFEHFRCIKWPKT